MPGIRFRSVRSTLAVTATVVAATVAIAAPASQASPEQRGTPAARTGPVSHPLTPSQLAGQRIIYSYPGLTPPASLLQAIREGRAAGVIFFGENISSKPQIASVIRTLDAANAKSPVKAPLLLMTDQEGGKVRRLPGAPESSAKQVGASADAQAMATETGDAAGANLRSVGMNVNLAPVLDVYRQEGNFIDQFGRSYGKDPAKVGQLGTAFINGQRRHTVAATVKHFPGLGAAPAGANTDLQPVTLSQSQSTIRSFDELPYRSAVHVNVPLVMTSWATYPALDPDYPAGLSHTIVAGDLRYLLGFKGVTITDALEAGALKRFGSTGHRALLAAGAGMDLILCSARDVEQGAQAAQSLRDAYLAHDLDPNQFIQADKRIIALRDRLG